MKWTAEEPTQPGWYRVRHKRRKKAENGMVHIGKQQRGCPGVLNVLDNTASVSRCGMVYYPAEYQWSGPIAEPEE